mmetsp:Transcript_71534/g.209679  ORF Transcript_71534/g.209679 Transcript_71534/m.209679 type:complete len:381 (-) Transcript_71534:237-1379(-)
MKAGVLLQGVREHKRKPLSRGILLHRWCRKALTHGEAGRRFFAIIARRGHVRGLAQCRRAAEESGALLAASQGGEVERGDGLRSAHEVYHVEVPIVHGAQPCGAACVTGRREDLWMAVVLAARLDEHSVLYLPPSDPGPEAQLLVAKASLCPPGVGPVLVREGDVTEKGLAEARDLHEDKPAIDGASPPITSPVLVCHEKILALSVKLLCKLPQCVSLQLSEHSVRIQHSHMSQLRFRQILGQHRLLLPVGVLTIAISDRIYRATLLAIELLPLPRQELQRPCCLPRDQPVAVPSEYVQVPCEDRLCPVWLLVLGRAPLLVRVLDRDDGGQDAQAILALRGIQLDVVHNLSLPGAQQQGLLPCGLRQQHCVLRPPGRQHR